MDQNEANLAKIRIEILALKGPKIPHCAVTSKRPAIKHAKWQNSQNFGPIFRQIFDRETKVHGP